MGILGFGKKKGEKPSAGGGSPTCGCGGQSSVGDGQSSVGDGQSARFLVLGACCQKSADTFANVKTAVAELGLSDQVVNLGDAVEIAKFGVMQTPALVIDRRVVSYGKRISVEEAKALIQKAESR